MRHPSTFTAVAVALAVALTPSIAPAQATAAPSTGPVPGSEGQVQKFTLYDGSKVEIGPDGIGWRTDANGQHGRPFAAIGPQAASALGDQPVPNKDSLISKLSTGPRTGATPGEVLIVLSSGTVDGAALPSPKGHRLRAAHTTDGRVNAALRAVGAQSAESLFTRVPAARLGSLNAAATARLGGGALDLARAYRVHVTGMSSNAAARQLRSTPGIAYAAPDYYVSTFATDPVPLPGWVSTAAGQAAGPAPSTASSSPAPQSAVAAPALPDNFGLQSSLQSYLNAGGVDLAGAYSDIAHRFGQIPGQGEIITNVSLGDLTDQSMAEAGDGYVRYFGPTTVVDGGQRYLDYPSLPRIPTYTADMSAGLDPLGRVEGVDPYLGEVLLDFSVMSPLPHDRQRPGAVGVGPTDLLGIAPGAQYRLVEPQQPTYANILTAMVAAAQQSPKPDVITASLGFGTDGLGFAGRYLEDDPLIRSVVAGLVQQDGIVVTISANDGTRMYTPAAVGPDGGSTPTNLAGPTDTPTTISDDTMSTTPSLVPDTGAIDVGGTTLDDTLAVPPQSGSPLSRTGTFAETRLDGSANFSSGFGTRVNVSAPSDNIAALMHAPGGGPTSVLPVLSGGTSASAPMTAAAAADVLQAARLTGHPMKPEAVRALLEQTGRAVPTQPQVDRNLHVGPQIDVTRAVESVLGGAQSSPPAVVRVSVAHRVAIGGAGATFVEATNPADINLAGPSDLFGGQTGEGLVGPVTIGLDATGVPHDGPVTYVLRVGSREFDSATPAIRVMPAELLAAAGEPLVSSASRSVDVTVQIRRGPQEVLASAKQTLTFGPTDGTHEMAPAPVVSPVVDLGKPVQVHYDLRGIREHDSIGRALLHDPELIVSSIDHWSPFAAPMYRIAYSAPLTGSSGTVTVPASVFAAGGGVYGVAVLQNSQAKLVGAVASFRVAGGTADQRPPAPTLATGGAVLGHQVTVSRAAASFQMHWDAHTVAGATGAMMEISAPGPTIYGLYRTFTNHNGTRRDDNGVDSGSVYWAALPSLAGTATFNPAKLGLTSSLHYNVRIIATHAGKVIGQASPTSSLEYDDGLAPDGATVDDFDINPSGTATVATSTAEPNGPPSASAIYRYTPATGTYGATYAQDTSGNAYFVYGSDPSQHRLIAAEYPWSGSQQHLLTYDTVSGKQVADVPIALSSENLIGARVDSQRHRAAILAWSGPIGTDAVIPVDTATGMPGTPVPADNGAPRSRFYRMLDIDRSTGKVDLVGSLTGDLCVIRPSGFTTVDLDKSAATAMTPLNRCDTGVASDQAGHAEVTVGPLYSYPMLPAARLQQVNEDGSQAGELRSLNARSPLFPIVDSVHHVLVVGFLGGSDYQVNNNGMSAVGVYDLRTGAQLSLSERFNFLATAFNGMAANMGTLVNERGIQLDPVTRTAWTYGPYGTQVQQFSY